MTNTAAGYWINNVPDVLFEYDSVTNIYVKLREFADTINGYHSNGSALLQAGNIYIYGIHV